MDNNGLNLLWWTCATGIAGWIFKSFIIAPLQSAIESLTKSIKGMNIRQMESDKMLVRHDEQIHGLEKRVSDLEDEK
jgi:hypothetical protein